MTLGKFNKAAISVDKKVVVRDLPYPVIEKNTFIIKNKVSGLNYGDVLQVQGVYPLSEAGTLGLET